MLRMASVRYVDLEDAYDFVSASPDYEHRVYLALETGQLYWVSDVVPLDEEVPEDLDTSDRYVLVPHQRELDLGRRLALGFVQERLPDAFERVHAWFRRPGAFARLNELLDERGLRDAWREHEAAAVERALREWCAEHGIEVLGARRRGAEPSDGA